MNLIEKQKENICMSSRKKQRNTAATGKRTQVTMKFVSEKAPEPTLKCNRQQQKNALANPIQSRTPRHDISP